MSTTDPIETIIEEALTWAHIAFYFEDEPENKLGLDFYLPDYDLYIEVKQFHSERISNQMSRAPNVIAVQGQKAAEWLADILTLKTAERG